MVIDHRGITVEALKRPATPPAAAGDVGGPSTAIQQEQRLMSLIKRSAQGVTKGRSHRGVAAFIGAAFLRDIDKTGSR
tara:strand:+ start:64 stop:297 length:234 start_codon:yes stop_codon:yes gene_type:complete